jgi:hypothetical protein
MPCRFAAVQQPDGSTKVLVTDVFAAVLAASHDAQVRYIFSTVSCSTCCQQLCHGCCALRHMQTIPLDPRRLDAVTLLHPSPPLRHRITSMAASPDGHHLLLMGTEVRRGRGADTGKAAATVDAAACIGSLQANPGGGHRGTTEWHTCFSYISALHATCSCGCNSAHVGSNCFCV